MKYRRQFFPIPSWVDLPHACDPSICMAFHFQHYRIYFFFRTRPCQSQSFGYISIRDIFARGNSQSHFRIIQLETLSLEFRSRRSCLAPGNCSPPLARTVFPALYQLCFQGVTDYLDDLVSRIEAPLMRHLYMTFFNQPFLTSDFSQLRHFIGRTEKFKSLTHADITFRDRTVEVSLSQPTQKHNVMWLSILCKKLHLQLWSLAQVGSASLLPLSKVESLEISSELLKWQLHEEEEHTEEDAQWLNVLQPFSAVKNLYPHDNTLPSLAYALKEVPEEQVTEVLPALQAVSMDEPVPPGPVDEPSPPAVQEAIERFIAMRRLSTACVKSQYRLGD